MNVLSAGVPTDEPPVAVVPPMGLYFPCISVPPITNSVLPPPGMTIHRASWTPGTAVWPPAQTTSIYTVAATSERYFWMKVDVPPLDTGDQVLLILSQEYLTGTPARINGFFSLEDAAGSANIGREAASR